MFAALRRRFNRTPPTPIEVHSVLHAAPRDNVLERRVRWLDRGRRRIWGRFDKRVLHVGSVLALEHPCGELGLFRVADLEWSQSVDTLFFATVEDIGFASEHPEYVLPVPDSSESRWAAWST